MGAAVRCRFVGLDQVEHHAVTEPELGFERLRWTVDQTPEGALVPGYETPGRRPLAELPAAPAARRGLGLRPAALVVDFVFRRLADNPALLVETLAAGSPGDLLEVPHLEDGHVLAVVLAELAEEDGADRHVDADAESVRAGDDLEQPELRELFDQQAVLRQQPRVVNADSEAEEAAHLFAVGGVETEFPDRIEDRLLLVPGAEPQAGQALRELGAVALGEVDDVDRRPVGGDELVDRRTQACLAVLVLERHRTHPAADERDRPFRGPFEGLADRRHVAQRRRHQQEGRVGEGDQGHLPRDAALPIRVVVELVHDHVVDRQRRALPERHVREHLGGAADDRRFRVDARIAGQHADALGAEVVAHAEELLRGEGLDRRRVEAGPTLAQALEQKGHPDQGLAGPGRRVEDHVAPGHQFDQRLLLRREELEAEFGDPVQESSQDVVGRDRPRGLGQAIRQVGGSHLCSLAILRGRGATKKNG